LKEQICQLLLEILEQKIKTVQQNIFYIKEARNNETKSSAGDKYETGRVMMQAELDKQFLLLRQLLQQQVDILKIKKTKPTEEVGFGSWVKTNQGNFLISIGLGKVGEAFVISLASPLGKALKGLKTGETTIFQNKEYQIKSVK